MTARERRRLDRIAGLAHELAKLERELDRSLARAAKAGHSLRTLERATGIPRQTLYRRLLAADNGSRPAPPTQEVPE